MTSAGNVVKCTILTTARVSFADTAQPTVKSQRSASKLLEEYARVNERDKLFDVDFCKRNERVISVTSTHIHMDQL